MVQCLSSLVLNEFVVGAETTSSGSLFHLDITRLEKNIVLT